MGTEDTVGGFTEFLAETARGIESENKQLVWRDTWDDGAKIPRKVKRERNRQTQIKATGAWILLNALFYKAGKVPWRLLPNQAEYRTSFLGVGFYGDLANRH